MISIKEIKVLKGILSVPVNSTLIDIACWVCQKTGELIITSGYRAGDTGVHGQNPLRGMDIRSHVYTDPKRLCELINDRWEYDPERPETVCAMVHGFHVHIHLQVHPRTELRH